MATKKFSEYAIEGQNVTLTYDNVNDTVTFDVVVDKNDVGLSNVDNTSDANKPISTATQSALNGKQDTLVSGTNIKTINSNSLLGSGDVVIDKSSVGLGNVANVDTTNASNITSGTLSDSRLSSNVTTQGNTFNAANKLVQLDASAKLPAVDGSQLTNLPSFSPPNGLLKIASAISTTFQVVKDYIDNASVLFLNSRRVGIGKDTSVTTQSVAVVEVQDTNTSIVLKPNGTGGIITSVPDGTATGGNARGNNAVDLQSSRGAATQVASGNNSVISGGGYNALSGNYAFIGGGFGNNTQASNSAIVGGSTNSIGSGTNGNFIGAGLNNSISSGTAGIISGGSNNSVSTSYSTISGGQSNTASTNTHATVVGGQSNTASGLQSVVGGASCVASGQGSFAIGGANTANSAYGSAFGFGSNTSGNSAMSIGGYGLAYLEAQFSQGSGRFSATGDAQNSRVTARRESALTSGATATLSLSGNGTTLLIIPNGNNRAWNVQIDTIAVVTAITGTATGVSVGHCYSETKQLLFKRIGGTSSIVGTVDTSAIKSDTSMSTAAITVTAGASQQMALTFTGPTFAGSGSITCRIVSKVMLVEVAY